MLAQLDNVCKSYPHADGRVVALQDVSLQLDPGDFLAVCGKSGCGKTTLLLTLGGLLRPDSGTITVRDTDLYQLLPNQRAQFRAEHIGFVFQRVRFVPYLSVIDNVLAATLGLNQKVVGPPGAGRAINRAAGTPEPSTTSSGPAVDGGTSANRTGPRSR